MTACNRPPSATAAPSPAHAVAALPHVTPLEDDAVSRYGRLEIRGNSDSAAKLYFNNHLVLTAENLEGDTLSFEGAQRLGASDVFVVSVRAGTACPAMASVVEIAGPHAVKFTKPFGTCGEPIKVSKQGDDVIVMRMANYYNPESFSDKYISSHLRMKEYSYSYGKVGPEMDRGRPTKADLAFISGS